MSDKIKNRAVVKIGYSDAYVLPLEQAVQILNAWEEAEKFERNYEEVADGKSDYVNYIGGAVAPNISISLLSDSEYHVAKLRGEKPEDT